MSTAASPRPNNEASPLLPRDVDLPNPSNLLLYRRAIGINAHLDPQDECNLEAGSTSATGIYASTITAHRRACIFRIIVSTLLYTCHAAQLIIGAIVTAMGPSASTHRVGITALGAANTVIAGVLTFMRSRGIPEKLRRNEVEFRRLQDWMEETEALLMLGVVGGTRDEVGELVAGAYKKWNLANERGEDVRPGEYSRGEQGRGKKKGLTSKWSRAW